MVRIAVAQIEPRITDQSWNTQQIENSLKRASESGTEVLVIPELANSGYVFREMREATGSAETIPNGKISTILKEWSESDRLVVAGICEKKDDLLFNSAVVFGGGEHLTTYRKIHLFDRESEWFEAGDVEPPVVEYNGYRYGVMICFDWAFPEMARILALKGAQVILHPANLVLPYCFDAMVTRSIENKIFTITANRIGDERDVKFTGMSQVTGPKGERLLQLTPDKNEIGHVDIDPIIADNKMITKRNDVLSDRKPHLYDRLVNTT